MKNHYNQITEISHEFYASLKLHELELIHNVQIIGLPKDEMDALLLQLHEAWLDMSWTEVMEIINDWSE
jgi:hypothetical protein